MRLRRYVAAVVAVAAVGAASLPGGAEAPVAELDAGASASATARFTGPMALDLVSVYQSGSLSAGLAAAALAAADQAGAPAVVGRGLSVGLTRVRRGGTVVQQATGGTGLWAFPTGVTVLPLEAVGAVMGRNVSGVLANGAIVMSQTAAARRGAQVGDVVDLVAQDGSLRSNLVGMVAPDALLGDTEILMQPDQADLLGSTPATRVLIYGPPSRDALEAAFAANGVTGNPTIRVRRSWDPPDPDDTIGLSRTKQLLGESAYRVNGDGSVSVDPTWRGAYIPAQRELYADIPIRAACNVAIRDDLQAALTEVRDAGLAGAIDVANANTYGGCFGPRFNRVSGDLGFLSRHTWAQALDTNTTTNVQGGTPHMDCRVVRIFRKHGFAWGGDFIKPDGMHFEWVGEPRDGLLYPSRYCPNLPGGAIQGDGATAAAAAQRNRATFFADDGFEPGGGE
jgi:hypothetical protein